MRRTPRPRHCRSRHPRLHRRGRRSCRPTQRNVNSWTIRRRTNEATDGLSSDGPPRLPPTRPRCGRSARRRRRRRRVSPMTRSAGTSATWPGRAALFRDDGARRTPTRTSRSGSSRRRPASTPPLDEVRQPGGDHRRGRSATTCSTSQALLEHQSGKASRWRGSTATCSSGRSSITGTTRARTWRSASCSATSACRSSSARSTTRHRTGRRGTLTTSGHVCDIPVTSVRRRSQAFVTRHHDRMDR